MVQINWGLAQNGAQNALAQGFQLGDHIRQRREEKEYKNALATVLTSGGTQPSADGTPQIGGQGIRATPEQEEASRRAEAVLAQRNPQFYMQWKRQQEAEEAARQQGAAAQRGKLRSLLEAAGNNPQQAFMAAQAEGIDLSRVPPPDSPEFEQWRQTQLFIFDTLERPDGEKILTEKMKETLGGLPPEHRDINDPVFIQAWNARMAAERQKTLAVQPGGSVVGYDPMTRQKDIIAGPSAGVEFNPDEWDVVGDAGGNASGGF